MRTLSITLLLLSFTSFAYAGVGACHDGAGNITTLTKDGRPSYFKTTPNCSYYELGKDGVTEVDYNRILAVAEKGRKYAKFTTEPVSMSRGEMDSVDAADLAAANAAKAAREAPINAIQDIEDVKTYLKTLTTT